MGLPQGSEMVPFHRSLHRCLELEGKYGFSRDRGWLAAHGQGRGRAGCNSGSCADRNSLTPPATAPTAVLIPVISAPRSTSRFTVLPASATCGPV